MTARSQDRRSPLALAALASAAVPGLDPASVEGVVSDPAGLVETAFVQDTEHRRWVVRCPRTPAASAQLEQAAALLALLTRRLTLPVPAVKGWTPLPEGGRVAVHAYLTGRPVDLPELSGGSVLAASIGRALALLHNLDPAVYEEAGVPVYDAEGYRTRRLADLDRAAATGRVPTGLLTRWERSLEDVSRWRFTTVATHGALTGDAMLATPNDEDTDADLKAFLAWESAQVADPADDFAALVGSADEDALDTVLEAYAHSRVQRPDPHLLERARLASEMSRVRAMTAAVATGEDALAEYHAAELRRLDERLAAEDEARAAAEAEALRAAAPVAVAAGTEATGAVEAEGVGNDADPESGQDHDQDTTVVASYVEGDVVEAGDVTTSDELDANSGDREDVDARAAADPDPSGADSAQVGDDAGAGAGPHDEPRDDDLPDGIDESATAPDAGDTPDRAVTAPIETRPRGGSTAID